MTQKDLNELIVFINDFLIINEDNASEKSRSVPSVFQKVLNIYYNTVKEYKMAKVILSSKIGERYRFYKEDWNRELSKIEIESYYIPAEEEITDIRKTIAILESQIKYLEETIANIKSMSFNIKNYIELKKFYTGDY
jgi:hypothetical protein